MELIRLQPDSTWNFYPEFKRRVAQFLPEYYPQIGDAELFLTETVQRWINTPKLAGYWLFLDHKNLLTADVVGHIMSYVSVQYTRPFVTLAQLELPDNHGDETDEVLKRLWFDEASQWIAGLNADLSAAGSKTIEYVEQWSRHPAKVWKRRFPWLPQERIVEIIRWQVSSDGQRE